MTRREQAESALQILKQAFPNTVSSSNLLGVPQDVLLQLRSMGEVTSYRRDTQWTLVGGMYDPRVLECFGPLVVMYIFGILLNEKQAEEMYAFRKQLLTTGDPDVPVPLVPRVQRPFSCWIGFQAAVFPSPTLPEDYDQEAIEVTGSNRELRAFAAPSREDYRRLLDDWILFSDWCMAHGWRPTDRPKWWFVCDNEEQT